MPGDHDFIPPEPPSQRMTNDDFRKLMMTPRGGSGSSGANPTPSSGGSALGSGASGGQTPRGESEGAAATPGSRARAENRKQKKQFYAKLKRDEDDKMKELEAKYRDRAKERRDGGVGTADATPGTEEPSANDTETDVKRQIAARAAAAATASANSGGAGYRAVAPDLKSSFDAAERRKRMINESKFLGGDMEHTHLVKGLDFALLQKVRSEIHNIEREDDEEDDNSGGKQESRKARRAAAKKGESVNPEEVSEVDPVLELQKQCRTNVARNIVRTVFKNETPKCNELFFPGRMAYVIDLAEEEDAPDAANAASDVPTTMIRSKADIEAAQGSSSLNSAVASTNDIVINKLTQILSYLRAGSRNKKKKRQAAQMAEKEAMMEEAKASAAAAAAAAASNKSLSIYDDLDDYVPDHSRGHRSDRDRHGYRDRNRDRDRERHRDRDHDERHRRDHRDRDRDRHGGDHHGRSRSDGDPKRGSHGGSYFERRPEEEDGGMGGGGGGPEHSGGLSNQDRDYIRKLTEREREKERGRKQAGGGQQGIALQGNKPDTDGIHDEEEEVGYAECYPGLQEMNDAVDDSDDEVDYTKMDLGNKKGPVGRWDFDNPEDYADYMSTKEALPKAAFQYGVKMSDGRKSGKKGGKNEKSKLNQEWNKISAIIDKRKGGGGGSGAKRAKMDD